MIPKNGAQHVFVSAGRPRPKLESAPGYWALQAEVVIGPHHGVKFFVISDVRPYFQSK